MGARATSFRNDALRFLVAGGLNTALTSAVYFLAALTLTPPLAYAIAWAVGIVFVGIVYPDRVFPGGQSGIADRTWLVASTATVFFLGLVAFNFLLVATGDHRVAFVLTLLLTMSMSFLAARFILRRGK